MRPQSRLGRGRRLAVPQVIDQLIARNDLSGVEHEKREQHTLLAASQAQRLAVFDDLERTEDSELHLVNGPKAARNLQCARRPRPPLRSRGSEMRPGKGLVCTAWQGWQGAAFAQGSLVRSLEPQIWLNGAVRPNASERVRTLRRLDKLGVTGSSPVPPILTIGLVEPFWDFLAVLCAVFVQLVSDERL
jgi:hypothetical protein